MKKLAFLAPFILALSLHSPPADLRQETAAPALAPSLYLMADIQVEVAKAPEYEAALKALIAALTDARFTAVFDTYATDDSRYYVVYGLDKGYGWAEDLQRARVHGLDTRLWRRISSPLEGRSQLRARGE